MGMGLGAGELIFVFLIVLLLFGAKRLPEIGSSLGKGIREFKSSFTEIERELKLPPDHQIGGTQKPARAEEADGDAEPRSLTSETESASFDDEGEPRTLDDSVSASQ